MRILVVLLCFFGWFKPVPFEIIESNHQVSVGGRQESGIATNYSFIIIANYNSEKLSIEDIWIDSVYFKVQPFKQNKDLSFSQTWEKGDTIQFRVTKRSYPGQGKEIKDFNGEHKPLPKTYVGDALLGYKIKGKQKYYIVQTIKNLPKQINP